MADLIAYQDGNFTGTTTFRAVVGGTGASQTSTASFTDTTTSYVSSSAFTVTNNHVIEGLLLFCRRNNTTGTVDVALSDDNGTTQTRTVSVNASDLPASAGWVFFKFGTTLTGDGGTDYRVQVRGSSAANAAFFRDATAGNWARLLRRNTSATIATTDVTYIQGELTGAGSVTAITVTMNSTANTSYGAVNIGSSGTLTFGTSASTNYYLRLAGNLTVSGGGTLNIGTSGTRMPSSSTATLEFNCSSNVQFGLEAQSDSTVNIYGAEKANTKVLLTADAASGQAVITVQDTTGWATSDDLGIASTTRTASQSEQRTISSIGSSTQATMTANLSFTHQGTSPYQAEVVNLTRNVKIRGTSSTLQSYVNCGATSSFTADNAEFFFLGSATTNKRGIDSATSSAGTFSINGCALRDFTVTNSRGLNVTGTTNSANIQNNVALIPINASTCLSIVATSGTPTISGNWMLTTQTVTSVFSLGDVGGTITNNRVAGGSTGFELSESATIGTFDGNIAHSSNLNGIACTSASTIGTVANCTAWRSNLRGFAISAPITLDNVTSYHNASSNIQALAPIRVINSTFNGGTGQSLAASTRHVETGVPNVAFENCDFGQTNQASGFIQVTALGADAVFVGCDIAESLTPSLQTNLFRPSGTPFIGFDKLNNTSGNHRAYRRYGYSGSDQSVYRTASPSEVLVPNTSGQKLPSGSKRFAVASGTNKTISTWVRKSAYYSGAEPRLILKRNIIAGITTDTVLDTITAASVNEPILDTYTGAKAAYSLRKLRTAYTGSAIRVRRDSDNTEQDIGFDNNGNLDESALTSFVGSASGFIRTWYDQSTNGLDATQTTNASQPRIVNAGVVDKVDGKPAIYNTNTFLNASISFTDGSIFSQSTVFKGVATGAAERMVRWGAAGNEYEYYASGRAYTPSQNNEYVTSLNLARAKPIHEMLVHTIRSTATDSDGVADGLIYALNGITSSIIQAKDNWSYTSIDRLLDANGSYTYHIFERIFWEADQSTNRAGITANTENYYNLYGAGSMETWVELSGSTGTVADNCVLEVYVDCDGTVGNVNVDDWSVT